MQKSEEISSVEIGDRIKDLLNREPGPMESQIIERIWELDRTGFLTRPVLEELPTESPSVYHENKKIIELADNYQLHFSLCEQDGNPFRFQAASGARSVGTMLCVNGQDADKRREIIESQAERCFTAGVPLLQIRQPGEPAPDCRLAMASLGLLRNHRVPAHTVSAPGWQLWLISTDTFMPAAAPVRENRLNDLMLALASRPWLRAAAAVEDQGILMTLTHMLDGSRTGLRMDSSHWNEDVLDFLFRKKRGGFIITVERNSQREMQEIVSRYDAELMDIASTTSDGKITVLVDGVEVTEIPSELVVSYSGDFIRHNESDRDLEKKTKKARSHEDIPEPEDFEAILKRLLVHPLIRSTASLSELADSTVRGNTLKISTERPIIRLKGANMLLTMNMAVENYQHPRDAKIAASRAVIRASRQLACQGAEPIAVSVYFKEGDVGLADDYFRFQDEVRGISEVCRKLKLPVTGNRIEWNQPDALCSPMVGVAGRYVDKEQIVEPGFADDGDFICILGSFRGELDTSVYISEVHGIPPKRLLNPDPDYLSHLNLTLAQAAKEGILKSAVDMDSGGLAVALVKSGLLSRGAAMGCEIFSMRKMRDDALLFGESEAVVLITIEELKLMDMERLAGDFGVACTTIGRVREHGRLKINELLDVELESLRPLIYPGSEQLMSGE